jgi:hypothetical protein
VDRKRGRKAGERERVKKNNNPSLDIKFQGFSAKSEAASQANTGEGLKD